jgi:autotransporter-associated beta strand protein
MWVLESVPHRAHGATDYALDDGYYFKRWGGCRVPSGDMGLSASAANQQMKPKARTKLFSAIAACSVLFLAGQASAQNLYWDSNGTTAGFGNTTGNWGTDNFWNTDITGGAGTFSIATSDSTTANFGTASANYANSAVAIDAGGVTVNSIVYGSGQTSAITLGTAGNILTLAGATPTITVGNALASAAQTISSNLSGSAGLTKAGSGTLFLSGTNDYSGGTNVTTGILSFRNTGSKSSGSGTHAFSSGTALGLGVAASGSFFTATDVTNAFNGTMTGNLSNVSVATDTSIGIDTSSAAFTYSADIGAVTRGLVKLGSNNLTLSGNNAYTGRTILAGGSVVVTSFGNTGASSPLGSNSTIEFRSGGNLTFSGDTVQSSDKTFDIAQADATFRADGTGIGAITLTAAISPTSATNKTLNLFGGNANDNTISGSISNGAGGALSLAKNLAGTWVLSGNNTYTGTTSVSAGRLIVGHANALGSTAGATTVSNNATLGLRGGITTAAEPLTLTAGTAGTAMLRNFSGTNTWSGSITSNTATSSNVSRIGSDAGKLTLAGTVNITGVAHQLVLQGDGDIDITGQITGVGIVSSATSGTGVRKLANDASDYTGQTRVNGSTLAFTSIANVGSSSSLGKPANATDGTINLGFDTNDATLRYVGTAPGGHTSDRVVRLNYGNTTTTANYTIEANGTGPLVLSSGVTAAAGSKTLTLSGTSSAANSIGVIANGASGAISLNKSGAGTWVLTGANTYTGATNVSDGTLRVSGGGSINSTSSINVAAGARFANNSSVALALAPTLNGNGTGSRAVYGGTGTLNAALTLDNVGDVLSPGNSPGIMTFGVNQSWGSYSYDWELNDWNTKVAGTNIDQISITGSLTLSGATPGSYILNVLSLTGGDVTGNVPNFSDVNNSWTILTTTTGISGFSADYWTINAAGFTSSPTATGSWNVAQSGNDLVLNYVAVPEPGAIVLAGVGVVAVAWAARRRRL